MEFSAKQFVCDAEKLLSTISYLEYFSYFKNLKYKQVARNYQKAADLYNCAGLYELAGDNYILAATYYIELDNTTLSSLNHLNAGDAYRKCKNYTKSTTAYLMVLEQTNTDKKLIIKCSSNIADNYIDSGNIGECVKWYEKCIQENLRIGRDDLNFEFYDRLGILYCTYLKRYAIGITIYDKIVEVLRKRNDVSLPIYYFISVLLRVLTNMESATKYLESLDKSFLQSEYADFLKNIVFFAGKDREMLTKVREHFEGKVPGLKNVNVQVLIDAVMDL